MDYTSSLLVACHTRTTIMRTPLVDASTRAVVVVAFTALIGLCCGTSGVDGLRVTLSAATPTKSTMKSQGRCGCIAKWTYKYNATSSVTLSGCANPDQDPKGDWCPVSKTCVGQYGNYTRLGQTIYYDYCGAVRGTTESGCICNVVNDGITGLGTKRIYDGCLYVMGWGNSSCPVDIRTCTTPLEKGVNTEYCSAQSNPRAINEVPEGTPTTQGGCTCTKGWGYSLDESSDTGPLEGCSSHDFDPKGSWCQVNPLTCPGAYGYFTQSNRRIYYDYCNNVTDFTRAGCRCKPIWGAGKLMDRCANPDGKPGGKWCEIMPGTCSKGTPEGTDWDYCGPSIAKPKASKNSTSPNSSSSSSGGNNTSTNEKSIVVVAPSPSSNDNKTRRTVLIVVPILTGLAAIITIMYTLYKCHKKRKFFKSSQLMKLQQYATGVPGAFTGISGGTGTVVGTVSGTGGTVPSAGTGRSPGQASSTQGNLQAQSTVGGYPNYIPNQNSSTFLPHTAKNTV